MQAALSDMVEDERKEPHPVGLTTEFQEQSGKSHGRDGSDHWSLASEMWMGDSDLDRTKVKKAFDGWKAWTAIVHPFCPCFIQLANLLRLVSAEVIATGLALFVPALKPRVQAQTEQSAWRQRDQLICSILADRIASLLVAD